MNDIEIKTYFDGLALTIAANGGSYGCLDIAILNPGQAYFSRLFVRTEMRNKGVAGKLMACLEQELDSRKLDCICEINPYGDLSYNELHNFYGKYGFIDKTVQESTFMFRKYR